MKKLILVIAFLMVSAGAHAGVISHDPLNISSTIQDISTAIDTAYIEINGNLDADNLKDDSLKESNFADEINPRLRTQEIAGDFTYSGHLPSTSTDLTSTISSGVSYINGYRVTTGTTSRTYVASRDTWVYIDQNGAFQFVTVTLGATQPATPINSLLLAKVTTDSNNITAVVDYRETAPPGLRVYLDIKNGCVLSRDTATGTKVTISRGEIELSGTSLRRRNTSTATVDFGVTGEGGLDTGSLAANRYYYIFATADSDNATNFEGIASLSSTDAAGVTDERLIGWCYASSATVISPDSVGAWRGRGGDAPNIGIVKASGDIAFGNITTYTTIPGLVLNFYSSGRPVRLTMQYGRNSDSTVVVRCASRFSDNGIGINESEVIDGGPVGANYWHTGKNEYIAYLGEGEHILRAELKMDGTGNISNFLGRTLIAEEL